VVKLIGDMALSFSSKGVGNVENSRAESVLFGGTLELPGVDDAGKGAMRSQDNTRGMVTLQGPSFSRADG
jgi:hypothetical protein